MTSKWFTETVDKSVSGVIPLAKKEEPTPVYEKVVKEVKEKTKKKESGK